MAISELDLWYKTPGSIIELQNKDRKIVGAIYTKYMKQETLVLAHANSDEKYYLYCDGFAIYFSYYRVLNKD